MENTKEINLLFSLIFSVSYLEDFEFYEFNIVFNCSSFSNITSESSYKLSKLQKLALLPKIYNYFCSSTSCLNCSKTKKEERNLGFFFPELFHVEEEGKRNNRILSLISFETNKFIVK